MSGIGSLFGGLGTGLQKGLQYDVDFGAMLLDAFHHNNAEELSALMGVMQQFLHEAADERLVVKGNIGQQIITASITGHDPFAGSRKLMQDVEAKYGKPQSHPKPK